MVIDALRPEAQAVLDELLRKGQLPYKLLVRELVRENHSQLSVHFHDDRAPSFTVTWQAGRSFKEVVRDAVLDRLERLGGRWN